MLQRVDPLRDYRSASTSRLMTSYRVKYVTTKWTPFIQRCSKHWTPTQDLEGQLHIRIACFMFKPATLRFTMTACSNLHVWLHVVLQTGGGSIFPPVLSCLHKYMLNSLIHYLQAMCVLEPFPPDRVRIRYTRHSGLKLICTSLDASYIPFHVT